MRLTLGTLLGLSALLLGCGGQSPGDSRTSSGIARQRSSNSDGNGERVRILDDCDPASFNAAIGPGTCVGKGETAFQEFIAELIATKTAEEWKFEDDHFDVTPGAQIAATNRGGETHTFTQVPEFGGGFVPLLNELSGNPTPAHGCETPAAVGLSFVPPGRYAQADSDGTRRQHRQVPVLHPPLDALRRDGEERLEVRGTAARCSAPSRGAILVGLGDDATESIPCANSTRSSEGPSHRFTPCT